MEPTQDSPDRQAQLIDWINQYYNGKTIPLSGELYLEHILFVARTAAAVTPLGFETGLCHDLLEDYPVSAAQLQNALILCGYPEAAAQQITAAVVELTDVYTETAFPELSKKQRLHKENQRLAGCSPLAQTVKYADLLYNIAWTLRWQPDKAARYLKRKQKLIKLLDKGDQELRSAVRKAIRSGLAQIGA